MRRMMIIAACCRRRLASASLTGAGRSRYRILDDGVLLDAVVIVPPNSRLRFVAGLQCELQKTADRFFVRVRLLDEAFRIVAERIPRRSTKSRVFVDDRTGRKFFEATRIDRVVLPVAITADDVEVVSEDPILAQPGEEPIPFFLEAARIRHVVSFELVDILRSLGDRRIPRRRGPAATTATAASVPHELDAIDIVWTDHRRRRDQNFEGGIAF